MDKIRAILERDRCGKYASVSDLDGVLWPAVCEVMEQGAPSDDVPDAVLVYYATRCLEHEVANGGFAQAAMNIPHMFEPAAAGYELLDKPRLAAFVRKAATLARAEKRRIDAARAGGVESAFAYFRERVFAKFDDRSEAIGLWENDQVRLDLVRSEVGLQG